MADTSLAAVLPVEFTRTPVGPDAPAVEAEVTGPLMAPGQSYYYNMVGPRGQQQHQHFTTGM